MSNWNDLCNRIISEGDDAADPVSTAYRAATALRAIYPAYDNDTLETGLIDALTDVLHLCDLIGLDFADLERRARGHYTAEVYDHGTARHPQLADACAELR